MKALRILLGMPVSEILDNNSNIGMKGSHQILTRDITELAVEDSAEEVAVVVEDEGSGCHVEEAGPEGVIMITVAAWEEVVMLVDTGEVATTDLTPVLMQ